ncbi:MAG: hypothetical protein CM1200mP37_7190 [Chloroflexota bacterium]|nr:MAG: hypothetical protein CM1200mP37_7190 [Chloroflexota bacterium]
MGKINQNVLFSVSDRTGLLDLAKAFSDFGYGLIATGKTCQYLSENNLEAKDVSGVTGFPRNFGWPRKDITSSYSWRDFS